MKTLSAFALLAALTGAWLCERHVIAPLHAQNQALSSQLREAAASAGETPGPESNADSAARRSGHAELLRLRNEVRQLRAAQAEADKLRAANRQLADELRSGRFRPRRLTDVEGAIPREKWAFAGFATPEAAVQSLLVGLSSGDPEQVLHCLPPHEQTQLRQRMTREPDLFRREFMGGLEAFARLSAFRITEVRIKEEQAMVEVQLTAEGKPVPFRLFREDNQEWKWHP